MRLTLVFTLLLLHRREITRVNPVYVGIIQNVSLSFPGANSTLVNGTCEECVCSLLANPAFFSLNCRPDILTCELHSTQDQNRPFNLLTGTSTAFYFRSLLTFAATTVMNNECVYQTTGPSMGKSDLSTASQRRETCRLSGTTMDGSSLAPDEYLWTFDSTLQDTSSTFNGTPINNATFSPFTITGYGFSLSLESSMNQCVSIDQPFLPLFNRSWTFEAWIYIPNLQYGAEHPVVGQYASFSMDKCLHLVVRDTKLRFGFFGDDLEGDTNLTGSKWYHVAFVFDAVTNNQSLYLDGILDSSRRSNYSYQGNSGNLNIGANLAGTYTKYFDGLIDQFSFTNRSKSSQEILRDATLTLFFSFDGNSIFDQGPLTVKGSLSGSTCFVPGWHGQALQIFDVPDSYLMVEGLVLLGRDNQSYSFSIWIKPTMVRQSSIIHMSQFANGTGFFVPIIGLTDTDRLFAAQWTGNISMVTGPVIPASSWTHAVASYSLTNGLSLYVNGSLSNSSSPFPSQGSGVPNHILIGSPRMGEYCGLSSGINR